MRLYQAITHFLRERELRNLSESTLNNYRFVLDDLVQFAGDVDLQKIQLNLLREWIYEKFERKLSPHTIWTYVVITRLFFRWCVEEGLLEESPAQRLQKPRLPEYLPRALTTEEVQKLLQAAQQGYHPERDRALILFLLETGARRSAVANLLIENLYLHEGVARTWTKGQREVWLFFDEPHVLQALQEWLDVRTPSLFHPKVPPNSVFGLTSDGIRLVFRRLRTRAGIKRRVSPHVLRHTCATMRAEQGIDTPSLQQIMGWKDFRVAERYTRMAINRIKRRASQTSPVATLFDDSH